REHGALPDRVGLVHRRGHESMSSLVVGGDEALHVVHQPGPLLRTGNDAVDRFVQDPVVDDLRVLAGGEQSRLVEHVGQIRAGERWGALGDLERSTSSASGLSAAWTSRMCRRPFVSGAWSGIWRSKRPGRSRAGSRTSCRLAAAMSMTLVLTSK